MKASECKCCECGKQAVAFYPCIDPDIPSYPYCADHLEKAMIEVAEAVWMDKEDMLIIAKYQAKQAADKYREQAD